MPRLPKGGKVLIINILSVKASRFIFSVQRNFPTVQGKKRESSITLPTNPLA